MADRFAQIIPEELNFEQSSIHNHLLDQLEKYFGGHIFTVKDSNSGALVGPFTQFLYIPKPVSENYIATARGLAGIPDFSPKCREVAILAIGEHYNAPYELYSHVRVAKKVGLEDTQIQDILEGRPPSGGTEQEIVAWEVARALVGAGGAKKGPLSAELWDRAEKAFGKTGAGGLIHYSGYYAYTSILLNGANVGVPEGETIWPISGNDEPVQ